MERSPPEDRDRSKLRKIELDLAALRILLHFPGETEPLTLDFDTPARRFCLSLIVPDLVAAIEQYVRVNNQNPRPSLWTKKVEQILQKISRCKATLETLH